MPPCRLSEEGVIDPHPGEKVYKLERGARKKTLVEAATHYMLAERRERDVSLMHRMF